MNIRTPRHALRAVIVIAVAGCGSPTDTRVCATEFAGSVCLDLDAAGGLIAHRVAVEEEVGRTLDAVRPFLDVTDLRVSLIADPSQVIPEVGLGGYNPSSDEVRLYADPAWPDLENVIRSELLPMLAHEIHHAMRRRAVGYGSTLLEAAVSEGLADHFSLEVSPGDPPPWSTALTPEKLAVWVPEVVARAAGTYDHAVWFFGADAATPRWTGYAVGFELVRQYLEQDPLRRASLAVGEPAASFIPVTP